MNNETINLTTKLVKIPSVTGNHKECAKAIKIIDEYLGKKFKSKTFTKNGFTSKLWSTSSTPMKPKLLLSGHLDVVDTGGNTKLFTPIIKNSTLIGRGAGDMKGHIAAMLVALKKHVKKNPNANISLLLTTDEEMGGFNGTRHVISKGLSPKTVFVPDGSINFNLVESEKAPHHFIVSSKGPGGHASKSFEIKNPINNIFNFYSDVRKSFAKADKKNPWASTFEMTFINTANKSKNKIPSEVTAAFSWRWPIEQIDFQKGRKKVLSLCKKHNCIVIKEEGGGEGTLVNTKSHDIKKWKKIIEKSLNKKVRFTKSHGTSDARHFYNNKKCGTDNIIITSAATGGHHASDEWIDINSLFQLSKSLSSFLDSY